MESTRIASIIPKNYQKKETCITTYCSRERGGNREREAFSQCQPIRLTTQFKIIHNIIPSNLRLPPVWNLYQNSVGTKEPSILELSNSYTLSETNTIGSIPDQIDQTSRNFLGDHLRFWWNKNPKIPFDPKKRFLKFELKSFWNTAH